MVFRGEQGPTPGQIRYIARLTRDLKMPEPTVLSFGEAGRMIQELKAEGAYRRKVKSNPLARACYNALASHGIAVHYSILTSMVISQHLELRATDNKVLAILNWRRDLFKKVDVGVYFLASKSEGKSYPQI